MSNRDLAAMVAALLVHVLLGVGLAMTPRRPPRPPRILTVEVKKNEPQVALPDKPPPPEPEKPKPRKPPEVAKAPPPNKTEPPPPPKEPPKEPPRPVFGVTMESTTEGNSSFVVPVGNTTMTDPKNVGKPSTVQPLPATSARPGPDFVPASAFDVSREPLVLDDPISSMSYPEGEAKNLGIEGETQLRIEIDDKGHVHGVKIVKGVGGGAPGAALDRMAQKEAYKLRFKPAVDKAGRAVAFVLPIWRVTWKLDQ